MNKVIKSNIFLFFIFTGLFLLTSCTDSKPANTNTDLSTFLKQNGLLRTVVLVQSGMIGCELSGKDLDQLQKWHQEKKFPDLKIVRLEINQKKAEEYYKNKRVGFQVIADPNRKIAKTLEADFIPCYVLIDKFGRIRYRGPLPKSKTLESWNKALASETADSGPAAPLFLEKTLDAGKLMSATNLPDLKGSKKQLSEYCGENGTLLLFVDTLCPYAASAIDMIPKVANDLKLLKINTVIINIDDAEEEVKESFKGKRLNCALIFDNSEKTKKQWHIEAVPTLILINPQNKIFYNGPGNWEELEKKAAEMLGLKDPIRFNAKKIEGG